MADDWLTHRKLDYRITQDFGDGVLLLAQPDGFMWNAPKMILLTAYGELQPNTMETALAASRKNKAVARTEPGCHRFDYFFSPDEPSKFVFVEEWATRADLDAHFAQANFKEFIDTLMACLVAPPEIRIFEATLQE